MIEENGVKSQLIEGRNAVMEAFRSGKPIDKVYVLDGCQDGPIRSIVREAKKHDTILNFVTKERLAQISETGKHQGVIAMAAAYEYAQVEDMLELAKEKGLKTIAFPLISAGVYGYPQRDAIRVAIETMKLHQDDFDEITLVLFGEREFGFAGEMFPEFIN